MRKDRVGWLDGLFIGASNATLVIDPSTTRRIPKTARVLVSHAHGDHTGGFRYRGLKKSTPPNRDIQHALHHHKISNFCGIDINDNFVVDDIPVKGLDAGRMLGSPPFLLKTPNKTKQYT